MRKINIKKMVKDNLFGINKKSNSRQYFENINLIMPKSKRSQVTVFIIIALAIIVVLILIFINRGSFTTVLTTQASPIDQIKKCMTDSMQEGIKVISVQGGSVNPENYILYNGSKVQYLCFTDEYYKTCVMQKPLLKNSVETELASYSKPTIERCISAIEDSLKQKGYTVNYKQPDIGVELGMDIITVTADNISLEISKTSTETYKSIKTDMSSKLYEFVTIASSISNWEARYGGSDSMTFMMYYPSLKIEKRKQMDGTIIYTLIDRNTKEQFIFAIKSLPLPSGVTGK